MEVNDKKSNGIEVALAGLDLSEMDNYVIRYAALICKILSVKRMLFMHVTKSHELPEEVVKEYPALIAPADVSIQKDLSKKVKEYFGDNKQNTEVDIVVKNGDAIGNILHHIKTEDVDLIFMGRKRSLKGSGIVSSRLARKSPCSLLLVPENPPTAVERIMVPVDFSGYAKKSLSYARLIASSSGASISCVNLYKVPTGYHTTGKSYDEFAEIMENHARKDYRNFSKSIGAEDIPCDFLLGKDGDHAELLYQHGAITKTSLIIIGSRGRTTAAVTLIGSLAEKLTYQNFTIPLLIIKKKGENMGFLEALGRL